MFIKNEYIRIKIGDKTTTKHNMFLNKYLKKFSKSQISTDYCSYDETKEFRAVYIKLDTPLEGITIESELDSSNFELIIQNPIVIQSGSQQQVSVNYSFMNDTSFILNGELLTDRSVLDGRQIMGISFGLETYLDTREYGLIFNNSEVLDITRRDIFRSDAICRGYEYPYHLAPVKREISYLSANEPCYAYVCSCIKSVGFGYKVGEMIEEYRVGKEVEIIEEDDFTFSFMLIGETNDEVYPSENSLYPSEKIPPLLKIIKSTLYPQETIWCDDNTYPCLMGYNYIIIKYKLYYETRGSSITDIGEEYTMSFWTDKKGLLNVKTKIERTDV